jgi:sulfofructose kinase
MTIKILTVGHSCVDIMYHVDSLPDLDEKISARNFEISIGGNAANVASAICDFGGLADICTVLGSQSHPLTRVLVSLLTSKGVGTRYVDYNDAADCSASTILITPDGNRTIVNHTDIRLQSGVCLPNKLDEYDMILGDSYRLPIVTKVFDHAKKTGIKTMLDVDQPVDLDLLPKSDYVWFSNEAKKYLQIGLPSLQEKFGGVVGFTSGSLPIYWMADDHVLKKYTPKTINAKNTLGAGDVFRARLACEICQHTELTYAIELASQSAAEFIMTRQIEEILKK